MSILSYFGRRVIALSVAANNRSVRAVDPSATNPRPLDRSDPARPIGPAWGHHHLARVDRRRTGKDRAPEPRSGHEHLVARIDIIRNEWDAFAAGGGRLPRIEQVLAEDQGNDGAWRAGLLVANGRQVPALAEHFPGTVEALRHFPGLRSALWSVLEPGTELPEHAGGNAGVLRYHLGVVANPGTALRVAGTVVPYREGQGVLFDDTAPHAAWNRGPMPRITLFCEVLRPLPAPASWMNRAVQNLLALDRRYRRAPSRAAEWHHALNPG